MKLAAKRLSLGLILIVAASALLLLSDLGQRKAARNSPVPRVAILKYASRPLLDDTEQGAIDALADAGFVNGRTIQLQRFNAENDLPTANTIAREITGGRFDMVISISTPCLQAVANANEEGKAIHVFGAVTDPFGAGVGISRSDPLDHPKHLVGVGTFQPVEKTFRLAKKMYPKLGAVGVVWNPAEACSEACTLIAREICKELDVELLEATVDNSAGVLEAAESLVGRGAEALWVGGDNTVEMAVESLLRAAGKRRIPVFNNSPGLVEKGVCFGLGADYYQVGYLTGSLAAKVLEGTDPATIPIEDVVPEFLGLSRKALTSLEAPWRFSAEMVASAALVIDERGKKHEKSQPSASADDADDRPAWRIGIVRWVDSPNSEESEEGILLGLEDEKVSERAEILHFSAEGDAATLNSSLDSLKDKNLDLLFVISTPTLQAAVQRFTKLPVVFTCVANPILAGAGKTNEDHRPNIAGISTVSAFEEMAELFQVCMPEARKVGTLFVPSEVNSIYYKDRMVRAMKAKGIEVVAVGVNSNSEVSEAALSMCARGIDAVCQISDNMTSSCFPLIEAAATRSKLPIFAYVSAHVRGGAVLGLARDYVQAGQEAGQIGAKILRGAKPAAFPFRPVSGATLLVNLKAARALGFKVPQSILERAEEVIK